MISDQPFSPFINGEIRCPTCKRKRPTSDLMGIWQSGSDSFIVKGIACSACRYVFPKLQVGLLPWGSRFPTPVHVPEILTEPACPFCGEVVVRVPDGPVGSHHSRAFKYVKCPASPLLYRLVVE